MSEGGLRGLVGKRISKGSKFMGEKVTISKLTVSEVMEIQEQVKRNENSESSEMAGLELLVRIIKMSCEEARELEDEDFESFPLEELTTFSNDIMSYSGMDPNKGK